MGVRLASAARWGGSASSAVAGGQALRLAVWWQLLGCTALPAAAFVVAAHREVSAGCRDSGPAVAVVAAVAAVVAAMPAR